MNLEARISRARQGDRDSLGDLLHGYRPYLKLLAGIQIKARLQSKVDPSDVVQEVFLDAHRYFPRFRGDSEGQLVGWLRGILAGTLANVFRRFYGTEARDATLERSIQSDVDASALNLSQALVAEGASPSDQAMWNEQSVLVADALDRLPEHYRTVILLRHGEGCTFPEVAERTGRSLDSVQKLWVRAVTQLRQSFGERR